tara:strand:+ start:1709 stop:1831 length:123 start_codon:yes stop_codon:yes gene_type:complete
MTRADLIREAKQAAWLFVSFVCVGMFFHLPSVGRFLMEVL